MVESLGKILIKEDNITLDWDDAKGYIINCDDMCSKCCRSYKVRLMSKEVEEFRKKYGISIEKKFEFSKHSYVKREFGKCVFLNNKNKCSIYEERPLLCRTFPFKFLENEEDNKIVLKIVYNPDECNAEVIKSNSEEAEELSKSILGLVSENYL